jgi:hypothetical protein
VFLRLEKGNTFIVRTLVIFDKRSQKHEAQVLEFLLFGSGVCDKEEEGQRRKVELLYSNTTLICTGGRHMPHRASLYAFEVVQIYDSRWEMPRRHPGFIISFSDFSDGHQSPHIHSSSQSFETFELSLAEWRNGSTHPIPPHIILDPQQGKPHILGLRSF